MYPVLRLAKEMFRARNMPRLDRNGTHVSHHICWPIDLDFNLEMNNGRVLTIYDIGRIPLAMRVGLLSVMMKRKWGFAMAGASVRYRRRIRLFDKFEVHSRTVARDDKFFYIEQTVWKKGEAASNILYRAAVTDKNGIVPTQTVAEAMGEPDWDPEPPKWVANWIEAEATRPWPPERAQQA